jgi:hypothetical protein
LAAYCFEDLNENERRLFEAHLLDCDFCWDEVQRLIEAVRVFRSDKQLLRSFSPAEVGSVLGLSIKLDWPLSGHLLHAVAASVLYALLYAIALLLEISYSFDSFGPTALRLVPLVLLWVGATTTGALLLGARAVSKGRGHGVAVSSAIIAASAVLLFLGLCLFLPNTPVTKARFQTYSAQAAFFKAVMYGVPTAILFLVLPFLSIVRMQRELRADRHAFVLALLTREKWAVAPRGMFFARPWFLWVILVTALIVSIAASSHLLDNLLPGNFASFFILLVQLRWTLYLAFGVECLAWYSLALNELMRECVAVERLQI